MNRQARPKAPDTVPVGTGRADGFDPDPAGRPDVPRQGRSEPEWENHWKLCKYL